MHGEPVGKGRARFVKATGRAYTPEKTARYEDKLGWAAQATMAGKTLFEGPLEVTVGVFVPIPESKPAKWKQEAVAGRIFPTKKPDADNYAKILDALNQIVWVDDSQIVHLTVYKLYDLSPRIRILVQSLC